MKAISPRYSVLSFFFAAATLAGCAGSTQASYQLPVTSQNTRPQRTSSANFARDASCQGQETFHYSGQSRNFAVPACATSVYVDAKGASGEHGGAGGEVSANIPVVPGQTLVVTVGSAGGVERGGFNGGGAGTPNKNGKPIGGGGGGASDVRQGGNTLADRVIVAGGGGGTAVGHNFRPHCPHCQARVASGTAGGGSGGGVSGDGGGIPDCNLGTLPVGGGGGTQASGGSGGSQSNGGSLGTGGAGVGLCLLLDTFNPGYGTTYFASGGGGGYYGGGGGGNGGSGGGGSGYAEPSATNVSSQSGVNTGNGSIVICWGYGNGCE